MNEFKERMKEKTLELAIGVLQVCDNLQPSQVNTVLIRQISRSITSVGANYREACRAKSRADFINKLQTVEAECDESIYWLEVIQARNLEAKHSIESIKIELNEILSIVVKAIITAKKNI
ncbi:MAG: four helix bundle protein [Bacteroidales bacterium]